MASRSALPAVNSVTRLNLDPALCRRGAVDGGWWPYSRDATAELPGLIAAIDQRLDGTTLRVGLHVDTWENIPRRIPARGRQVTAAFHPGPTDPDGLDHHQQTTLKITRHPATDRQPLSCHLRKVHSMTIRDPRPLGRANRSDPTTVCVSGDVDIFTSNLLRERLLATLRYSTRKLILNLSGVTSCDASGLAALVGIQRRARSMGITLALSVPSPYLSKLLNTNGLDHTFATAA